MKSVQIRFLMTYSIFLTSKKNIFFEHKLNFIFSSYTTWIVDRYFQAKVFSGQQDFTADEDSNF